MPHLILIGGGTGSGKSTIAAGLKERLAPRATVYSHDHYYRDLSYLTAAEQAKYNFDHPDAIDSKNLTDDLGKLLGGSAIDIPVYDYSTYTRSTARVHIIPSEIIIIEGIFALYYEELTRLSRLRIYVETGPGIRLERRIKRDTAERGYSRNEVLERYRATVSPMHDIYVEQTKKSADMIVRGEGPLDIILDEIMIKLAEKPKIPGHI